jgi:hypothetical protein
MRRCSPSFIPLISRIATAASCCLLATLFVMYPFLQTLFADAGHQGRQIPQRAQKNLLRLKALANDDYGLAGLERRISTNQPSCDIA